LFQKATTAKHLKGDPIRVKEGEVIGVKEGEVIGVLRSKIDEKDITINRLHSHLDDLNNQLTQIKEQLQEKSRG
jgi:prefoldin subunit 5